MRGKFRKISPARQLIADLMHVSMTVPRVAVRRTLNIARLVEARSAQAVRPGWAPIFAKAFAIAARDDAHFRTFYLRWPWPHLYEVPDSVAMISIVRTDFGDDAVHFLKIGSPDQRPLAEIEAAVRHGKSAPLQEVPSINRMMKVSRLPLLLRRLAWFFALNIGRQRANHAGTFSITSVASLGIETVTALFPGPSLISYGMVRPDNTVEILFHWDHRIYDGTQVARALDRLEEVLNGEIADEIAASGRLRSAA